MTTDVLIRAFREQPDLLRSFELFIEEQREKVHHRIPAAPDEKDLFRLQGELRALTNCLSAVKTMLGNSNHARTREEANGRTADYLRSRHG